MSRAGRLHKHGRVGPICGNSPFRKEDIDSAAVRGQGRIWMRRLYRNPTECQRNVQGFVFQWTDMAGEALKMVGAAQSAYELASQMTTALCAHPIRLLAIGSRAVP